MVAISVVVVVVVVVVVTCCKFWVNCGLGLLTKFTTWQLENFVFTLIQINSKLTTRQHIEVYWVMCCYGLCFSCSCCFCCYCCCCCCFCCYCICSAITECCHNRTLWREKSCIIRLNCLQIPLQHIFFSFRNNKSQKVWIVPWYSIHMPHHSMLFSIIIMINIYMCIDNFI